MKKQKRTHNFLKTVRIRTHIGDVIVKHRFYFCKIKILNLRFICNRHSYDHPKVTYLNDLGLSSMDEVILNIQHNKDNNFWIKFLQTFFMCKVYNLKTMLQIYSLLIEYTKNKKEKR